MMKKNIGGIDKTLRIIVGLIFIGLAAANQIGWWGFAGVIPLLTALISFCPLYRILGISSCKSACEK